MLKFLIKDAFELQQDSYSKGKSGGNVKFSRNQGKSGRIRDNKGKFSIIWKNRCFSENIREYLFTLNFRVTSANDCT